LGSLENLEPDGRGHLFLSATARDSVEELSPDGATRPVATGIRAPGGLRLQGTRLLVTAGNAAAEALTGRSTGMLLAVDLQTRVATALSSGLVSPNGLVLLPDGDALVSRTINAVNPTGVTLVDLPSGTPKPNHVDLDDSNGLALDAAATAMFVAETFTAQSRVFRVPLDRPQDVTVVAETAALGVPKGLDDITADDQDVVYAAANGSGEILRIDTRTGDSCVIAAGLRNPSAIKHGLGCGEFGQGRLYVTGFDGTVRELAPPPGVRLVQADARPGLPPIGSCSPGQDAAEPAPPGPAAAPGTTTPGVEQGAVLPATGLSYWRDPAALLALGLSALFLAARGRRAPG
jgi:hypothetical protein